MMYSYLNKYFILVAFCLATVVSHAQTKPTPLQPTLPLSQLGTVPKAKSDDSVRQEANQNFKTSATKTVKLPIKTQVIEKYKPCHWFYPYENNEYYKVCLPLV